MSEKRILIVDDEPAIRSLLRCAVATPGFAVFEADCARTALGLAIEQGRFELVVTDVLMPGMDGIQLARELCAAGHAEKFLFISGYCDPDTVSARLDGLQNTAFLGKPFSIPDLLGAVHRLLQTETGKAHTASVRHRGARQALQLPPTPLDRLRALRRKSLRLRSETAWLCQSAEAGIRFHSLLIERGLAEVAAIRRLQRRAPMRRAMLEGCSGSSSSCSSC